MQLLMLLLLRVLVQHPWMALAELLLLSLASTVLPSAAAAESSSRLYRSKPAVLFVDHCFDAAVFWRNCLTLIWLEIWRMQTQRGPASACTHRLGVAYRLMSPWWSLVCHPFLPLSLPPSGLIQRCPSAPSWLPVISSEFPLFTVISFCLMKPCHIIFMLCCACFLRYLSKTRVCSTEFPLEKLNLLMMSPSSLDPTKEWKSFWEI